MIKKYNKLVRDRIPEIIVKKSGERPYTRVLNKKEFFGSLKKKPLEEAKELLNARDDKDILNELVDLQELIDTIIAEMGISKPEFRNLQKKKNKEKGGFKKRLFLIKTKK